MRTRRHLAVRRAKPTTGRRWAACVSAEERFERHAAVKERGPDHAKSRPVKDRERLRLWAERHDFCQVCWIPQRDTRWARLTGLQTHHIIKPGRSDEPCNLLRVCGQCHRIIEGERVPDGKGGHWPRLALVHVLYSKREHDSQEYDPDRLVLLWRHRARMHGFDPLPEPEPLPEAFLAPAAPVAPTGLMAVARVGLGVCWRVSSPCVQATAIANGKRGHMALDP